MSRKERNKTSPISNELVRGELLKQLSPENREIGIEKVWELFFEILKIPRASGHEEKIRQHIVEFCILNNFQYEIDSNGNLLIEVPPTIGYESSPGIVLQGHMDMVCKSEPGAQDPAKFGVSPVLSEDKEWIRTKGTTLGADNGIGVALMLSLAEDKKLPHGPLAILLTVDEESGMTGACNITFRNDLQDYQYLLNFDSEEDGVATFSGAGAAETNITLPVEREELGDKHVFLLKISGLSGGHSGMEIHKMIPNATKILTEFMQHVMTTSDSVRIIDISGGDFVNAIPDRAQLAIAIDISETSVVNEALQDANEAMSGNSIVGSEPIIVLEKVEEKSLDPLTRDSSTAVLKLLNELPHGVITWSSDVPGLVQTSTNLAITRSKMDVVVISMMSRGSVNEELLALTNEIRRISEGGMGFVEETNGFSGWKADLTNPLLPIIKAAWKDLFNSEIRIEAVHAGVECGLIINQYPHLSAIAIGPTIHGAHTTSERVNIESVSKFYRFAKQIIGIITQGA